MAVLQQKPKSTPNEEEQEVLDIYERIQEAKILLDEQGIKQSGKNNYQKYNYFELKDFMPYCKSILKEVGLSTQIKNKKDKVVLYVRCKSTGEKTSYWIPRPVNTAKDDNKFLQTEGKVQTYCMRYLYMQMFEITITDPVDSGADNKQKQTKKTTTKSTPKPKPKKQLKKFKTVKEVANEVKHFYEDHKIEMTKERVSHSLENYEKNGQITKELFDEAMTELDETFIE